MPKGQRVLELGCGDGKLLAALEPGFGVGVDFSSPAVQAARKAHPHLHWVQADVHSLPLHGRFDVIILSDLLNDVWDAQLLLERLRALCHTRTRIIINSHSRLWQLPLSVAEALGLKKKVLTQNWFTTEDTTNLLDLASYQPVKGSREILLPLNIPLLTDFLNSFLVKLPFSACLRSPTTLLLGRWMQARGLAPARLPAFR